MKTLSRKMLCLVVLTGLSAPLVVRAQDDAACESGDIECQALAYTTALSATGKAVDDTRSVFSEFLGYVSTRFEVDLRFDGNGQDGLSGLYPSLTKLIEQDVASNYGLSLPLRPPGGRSSHGLGALVGTAVGTIGLAVYLGDLFDQRLNGSFKEAMAQDIRSRGWSLDLARREADFQFTSFIQSITNFVPIHRNQLRDIQIVLNRDYYIAWQARIREAERPAALQPRGGPRYFPSVGDGGPAIGAPRGPGGVAFPDCWIYHPSTGWHRC
jgi:hypothetical protein